MNGTARTGLLNSNSDVNDSTFSNKRKVSGSTFDFNKAEPSQHAFNGTSILDSQRAESSWKHVRALNTQFASWVQLQLKNHPDELWEDGVQDYLAHAADIMEKFSDVVTWLKANSVKGDSLSAVEFHTAEKKLVPEIQNDTKLFQEKNTFAPVVYTSSVATSWNSGILSNSKSPDFFGFQTSEKKLVPEIKNDTNLSQERNGFAPSSPTTCFAPSWQSGIFSNSQTPGLSGSQNSALTNNAATNVEDDENHVEQPSSPSVKKNEEKGIILVHEVKVKLYVKSTDPEDKDTWKDRGTGQLTIKCREGVNKGIKESKATIIVRNDLGKVLLNALLYPGIKTNVLKNSLVAIFHTTGNGGGDDSGNSEIVARTFLIRTRSEEDRNKLATAIQDYAPSA